MIEIVNANDARAVRNKENVLALYDAMINRKNPEEAVSQFLVPNYIQHNPLIPDSAAGLAGFFSKMTRDRANLRVVVHRIIAVGDYVWAHVNFINLFNDDPKDPEIAGVDIYRMNSDGKAIEHWDVLQEVGDPKKAAHANGMF